MSILRSLAVMLISGLTSFLPAHAQSNPPYLQQAFYGVNTLQSWYTPGTGLYQTTGWWNSANAITVLANYSRLDRTKAYFPVFANTFQQAPLTNPGFVDGYYDDDGWWALAWIDAYDLTQNPRYLATARSIFATMTGAWDNTCGGGIWWNTDRQYKNAIANELFLSVAGELAARTTDPAQRSAYLAWAQQEWNWFKNSGMINSQNLINDGLDTATCSNNGQKTWSYNQGVILGGLTQLNALMQDATLIPTAKAIADAAVANLTTPGGILTDGCEPNCGQDGVQFKGVFLRNLMALQAVVHDPGYTTFADTNAESIWNNSRGPNDEFGQAWAGPFDVGNAGSQSSALDAFLAAAAMQANVPGGSGGLGSGTGNGPNFTLGLSPGALNLALGADGTASVTLTPQNGFSGAAALTATVVGAPAGVKAALGSPTLSSTGRTTLSVSTTAATPGGNYLVAVTGVSGALAQTAYLALGLPDFSLGAASSTLFLNQSGKVSDTFKISAINGFRGDVNFSLSALPPGVTGSFSPETTANTTTLTLDAGALAPTTSTAPLTVTANTGGTTHTTTLSVAVSAAAGDCGLGTLVDLSSSYNLIALREDGMPFTDGGLDGLGSAYSSNLLGPARVLNGIRFVFGPADTPDAVYAAAQTISLPAGHFNALQFIGTAVGGNQAGQVFTVTYSDGSTAQYRQSFSDWFSPGENVNEAEAVAFAYRNSANGTADNQRFNAYGYTLELDPAKSVKSLTLPSNRDVVLLAATLSRQDFGSEVNLAGAYNATGIYTDGTTFAGNGGLDGGGTAYSANLLNDPAAGGEDVVVGPSHFDLAAANAPNALYAAGQTISLPFGFYQYLKLLGTGVQGNQTGQTIQVIYADGTKDTLTQSVSDWSSPAGYPNESVAIRTAYRDTSSGSQQSVAFNVYLYTLKIDPFKLVKSIILPTNRDVVLLGITLAPPSIFELDPGLCRFINGDFVGSAAH